MDKKQQNIKQSREASMITITIPSTSLIDYADIAALSSRSIQDYCFNMLKQQYIDRVKHADAERQAKGRAFFDLEEELVPVNWEELSTDEKVSEGEARMITVENSAEGKALFLSEDNFLTACEDLILLVNDGHSMNIESPNSKKDLHEQLVFSKVDEILEQRLFAECYNDIIKNKNDTRKAALMCADMAVDVFFTQMYQKVCKAPKNKLFNEEGIFESILGGGFASSYVSTVQVNSHEELQRIGTILIGAREMPNREKVRTIHKALEQPERPLIDYVRLFAKNEGFGLNCSAESISESLSRSKFMKQRKVNRPPDEERRVC